MRHQLFIHDSDEVYGARVGAFVQDGLDAGEFRLRAAAHAAAGRSADLSQERPAAGFGFTASATAASGVGSWPPMSRRKGG
jgi:hypothetical protein